MMLNMDRMVGTITPKNVFSLRGSVLGLPELDAELGSPPHMAEVTARPHTPEVIRGVRSFDMAAQKSFPGYPVERKNRRGQVYDGRVVNRIALLVRFLLRGFVTTSRCTQMLHKASVCCVLLSEEARRCSHPPPQYSRRWTRF